MKKDLKSLHRRSRDPSNLGSISGSLFGTQDFFGRERALGGPVPNPVLGTHLESKSQRKGGRRDKKKRSALERRNRGLDEAGARREALGMARKKPQNRERKAKSQARNGSRFWVPFGNPKRNRCGAEIT